MHCILLIKNTKELWIATVNVTGRLLYEFYTGQGTSFLIILCHNPMFQMMRYGILHH